MNYKSAEDRVVRYHSGECAFPIKPIFYCRLILSHRKEQCQEKISINSTEIRIRGGSQGRTVTPEVQRQMEYN